MIIPSIDIQGGRTVQLIGGEDLALEAGDPQPIAKKFGVVGEIAVIDLDAAMGTGNNSDLIRPLLRVAPCRVGGGIRTVDSALDWLDAGATKVIIGTAASPHLLQQLPKDRVVVALDARNDEIVVEGWKQPTGKGIVEGIQELKKYTDHFLITFVELEGRLKGTDLKRAERLIQAAAPARITFAGGITTAQDIADLHDLGADAQVGMALYTGKLSLADAIAAPLSSDRADGLWPTVITDEYGVALGLAYSNHASLEEAIRTGTGVYFSRSRGSLWKKGETSGAVQELLKAEADCDSDTLRFAVKQAGDGFCHLGTRTCWGEDRGLTKLARRLNYRRQQAPAGSYTQRLFQDSALLDAKLREEAEELIEAKTFEEVRHEAADLLYFTLVRMTSAGVSLEEVERELDRRSYRVRRRPGNAKPTDEDNTQ